MRKGKPQRKPHEPYINYEQDFIRQPNGCWEWKWGTRGNGYGSVRIGKKKHSVHRVVYNEYYGEIPKYYFVCHMCDNPPCANPEHLWLGTHKDNMRDKVRKARTRKGYKN